MSVNEPDMRGDDGDSLIGVDPLTFGGSDATLDATCHCHRSQTTTVW